MERIRPRNAVLTSNGDPRVRPIVIALVFPERILQITDDA